MSREINNETIRKLEALFLNQVEGLYWYYFDLDLNNNGPTRSEYQKLSQEDQEWLNRITLTSEGKYQYRRAVDATRNDHYSSILGNLITFLRKSHNAPRNILKRIFDENDPSVLNQSKADEGLMGKANRQNAEDRKEVFDERIRSTEFQQNGISILAEGDSWFQHPPVKILGDSVKDIIDWLIDKNETYAIYSMAAGGDWLSNMIRTTDYISMLDRISPDAFLFSGGGNDMMGGYRIAKFLRKQLRDGSLLQSDQPIALEKCKKQLLSIRNENPELKGFDLPKYKKGLGFLNMEFFNFLNITMSQYYLLLTELTNLKRFSQIKFITQGYDFVIPSSRRAPWLKTRNRLVNNNMNSGRWLHDPMLLKGIFSPEDQEAIAYTMVWEFNEMLIQLSHHFPQLYHVDCRGTARSEEDWFDEIHLKSHAFERIANTFKVCIESTDTAKKVYRVVEESPA